MIIGTAWFSFFSLVKIPFPLCTCYPANLQATSLQCVCTLNSPCVAFFKERLYVAFRTHGMRWNLRMCRQSAHHMNISDESERQHLRILVRINHIACIAIERKYCQGNINFRVKVPNQSASLSVVQGWVQLRSFGEQQVLMLDGVIPFGYIIKYSFIFVSKCTYC